MKNDPLAPSSSAPCDDLAGRHVALVAHLVREMMTRVPSGVDRRDLQAAGLLALLDAARETDAAASTPFSERAAVRVRGALVDELRSVDWAVRAACPRDPAAARARLDAVLARFRDPAAADVLEHAGAPVRPPAASGRGWVAPRAHGARRERLAVELEALPEHLQCVVRGYFLEQRPMAEVAAEAGVSEPRAAQLRDEALVLLRDALVTTPGSDTVPAEAGDPVTDLQDLRHRASTRAVAAQHAARQSMTEAPRERTIA